MLHALTVPLNILPDIVEWDIVRLMTAKLNFAAVKAFFRAVVGWVACWCKNQAILVTILDQVACIVCIFCFSLSILIASSLDSIHQSNESSGEDSCNGSK
jgi:hypothetical protein